MTIAAKTKTIDELHGKARDALASPLPFEAERLATMALQLARQRRLFSHMNGVLSTLLEARLGRMEPAIASGRVVVLDEPFDDAVKVDPGCYLVRPPLVGADARRLRLLALSREIPAIVVCREPTTQLRLCPVVAISSGATVRTKIDPPADENHPDLDWLLGAIGALGDWAIESLDSGTDVEKRIDALMARLDAVPEHRGLHECLQETCLEAAETSKADVDR